MYKDVWKRFGTKILIVLCSVLLLGGVAIAAPRLRADSQISLRDIKVNGTNQSGVPTGPALVAIADQPYVTSMNGTAGNAIPRTLQLIMDGGGTKTLSYGTDYFCSEEELKKTQKISGNNGADEVTITIKAPDINNGSLIANDNATLDISYKIPRAELPKADKPYRIKNTSEYTPQDANKVLIVGATNQNLTTGEIKVYLDLHGSLVQLPESEFVIRDENGNQNPTAQSLGGHKVRIYFNNYKLFDGQYYDEFAFAIKKDASKLEMQPINEDGSVFTPTKVTDRPKTVMIMDEGADVSGLGFESPVFESRENTLKITVHPDPNGNYINSCTKTYTVVKTALSVRFKNPLPTLEYNEKKHSYRIDDLIEKPDLLVKVNNVDRDLPANQYEKIGRAHV